MAPVPRLSMEDRLRVVVLHEEGNSCNKVAQKMKVARSTVQAIVKKHRETGTRKGREGRGRKKRITDREDKSHHCGGFEKQKTSIEFTAK